MAEFLWTFAVQEILKKVLTLVAEQIILAREVKDVLQQLQKELVESQKIVSAITTQRQNHYSPDSLVTQWVNDLQLIVHEADDLLDLFVYEHLQQRVNPSAHGKIIKKVLFISYFIHICLVCNDL